MKGFKDKIEVNGRVYFLSIILLCLTVIWASTDNFSHAPSFSETVVVDTVEIAWFIDCDSLRYVVDTNSVYVSDTVRVFTYGYYSLEKRVGWHINNFWNSRDDFWYGIKYKLDSTACDTVCYQKMECAKTEGDLK